MRLEVKSPKEVEAEFTTIELFVVKNNELAPDIYTLKISPSQGFEEFAKKTSEKHRSNERNLLCERS